MDDIILDRFKQAIDEWGMSVKSIDNEGFIFVEHREEILKVSLDNVRKRYLEDGNFDYLDELMDSIREYFITEELPVWNEAKDKVFLSLFPSDFDFSEYPHEKVTKEFCRHYVYYDNEYYVWIDYLQLNRWHLDEGEFLMQVDENMNALLERSKIEILETENHERLAVIDCEISGLKSALLFSTNLKQKVLPVIGFPVYCVLPVRDFCYLFSEQDKSSLIDALGEIVINEYKSSGYQITTEIIRISDDGIEAIGKYEE